ncbi:MAG: hypothetical protein R3F05_05610 [Planctomycetota bacterium]
MHRMLVVAAAVTLMGGGAVLARGRAPREPREPAYKVDARWAAEAQRAELKWPTLRGTCRIEAPVVDPTVTYG